MRSCIVCPFPPRCLAQRQHAYPSHAAPQAPQPLVRVVLCAAMPGRSAATGARTKGAAAGSVVLRRPAAAGSVVLRRPAVRKRIVRRRHRAQVWSHEAQASRLTQEQLDTALAASAASDESSLEAGHELEALGFLDAHWCLTPAGEALAAPASDVSAGSPRCAVSCFSMGLSGQEEAGARRRPRWAVGVFPMGLSDQEEPQDHLGCTTRSS